MATNFATLKARVLGNVIDQPAFVTSAVPDLINQAIEDVQDKHDFKVTRTVADFTTTAATRQLGTMPENFTSFVTNERPYFVALDGSSTPLDMFPSEDQALREFSFNDPLEIGAPRALSWEFATVDSPTPSLSVWPYSDTLSDWTDAPAGEYRIKIAYYGNVTALVDDADTNWFTNNGAAYIEHYATALAFMKDWDEQRASTWFTTSGTYRDLLIKHDNSMRTSQSRVLIPRSDVNASVLRVRF